MIDKQEDAREIALNILMDILENNNYSHTILLRTLKQHQSLSKADRALITRICEGTTERMLTLDYILNHYSNVKVNKMKPLIRNLLRMSIYQLKYMDQIPESAVCNEAVKLAKKRGFRNLSGFVNGVLRNIIRDTKQIEYPKEEKEPGKFLSVVYSVPEWLVTELLQQYDYEVVKGFLTASLKEKKTTIRCNLNRIKPEGLKTLLEEQGVTVEDGSYLPYAYKISNYNYFDQMDAFTKGYFQIQDESSMLVGAVSGVKEGNYVIDVCAAPGGKSLHIAEMMNSTGLVSSRDISEKKTSFILENIKRLGFKNVSVKVWDALLPNENDFEKADIVIADLPCSGLGVIGKKPDIKYNMTKEKLNDLALLQREILTVVRQYVKKGGVLIYSTCTINREENIENVRWFTENFDFKLESMDDFLPKTLHSKTTKEGYLQLIPGLHDTDGFFLARLRKESE